MILETGTITCMWWKQIWVVVYLDLLILNMWNTRFLHYVPIKGQVAGERSFKLKIFFGKMIKEVYERISVENEQKSFTFINSFAYQPL